MKKVQGEFLLGAATAAHQVEGNNTNSDFWAMEQMEHSVFKEPSLDAADHYNRYREDIDLMAEAGLNAYRFSIEWARIEPEQGYFDEKELEHYRDVIKYCRSKGIEPIVTMHHFSSPKWVISQGGWENEGIIEAFKKYCVHVMKAVGSELTYVCTINEANMGLQMADLVRSYMKNMKQDIQVGVDPAILANMKKAEEENIRIFGTAKPEDFLSARTEQGDRLIMRAHEASRDAIKAVWPHLKVGITLSLHDFQPDDEEDSQKNAQREWEKEFSRYLPYIANDDFFGVQNYTRKLIGTEEVKGVPEGAEVTQMNYEYYPEALEHVIRKVAGALEIPIMVTENGVASADDGRRISFIKTALDGVAHCIEDGIDVIGYMHWSLLDNFEWQMGFAKTFGLIAVDQNTQKRIPKDSLRFLGNYKWRVN